MKKLIASISLFLIVLTACTDSISPLDDGTVLSEIRYESGNQVWTERYEYTDDGRVKSITNDNGLDQRYDLVYANGRLLETRTIRVDGNQLVFRDSMAYNSSGQVERIYKYSINAGADLPLSNVQSLTYNNDGQLIETSSDFVRITDYAPRRVYHWRDGNVSQADHYNGEQLQHEFFFTYDDKPGLYIERFVTIGGVNFPTKNNLISTDWKDYTGLLDTVCKPCELNYSYGKNDLPVILITNWGQSASFTYKQLPVVVD